MSEKMTPEENFKFLNDYFAIMDPVISTYGGYIDKYIGDAIMAIFDEPEKALDAAITMQYQLREYNVQREQKNLQPIAIGIGINTGEMMIGTVGGYNRMEGTVISDAVNIAARIEGLNKQYGTTLLISENTYNHLKGSNLVRFIDNVLVKGKTLPVKVYEVFNGDREKTRMQKSQTLSLFNQAITFFESNNFQESKKIFSQIHESVIDDEVVNYYLQKIDRWGQA